jgi:hypothetical protein
MLGIGYYTLYKRVQGGTFSAQFRPRASGHTGALRTSPVSESTPRGEEEVVADGVKW